MSPQEIGTQFGLDSNLLKQIDWKLALARIIQDLRSDFIYAPHLGFIYRKAQDRLIDQVHSRLASGSYSVGLPLTIEVPKTYRIRVKASIRRLGPNYSRPGSILLPHDRLLYQALADQAGPIVKASTDSTRSFSHRLEEPGSPSMFAPTRECWAKLQKALANNSKPKSVRYVLKLDVANYFGSINQHKLINVLQDAGYPSGLASRLEAVLSRYTGERNSRGILQGIFPSDLFGNYYLAPIDLMLKDLDVPSARYVDDIYVFLKSVDEGEKLLRAIIPALRSYDLVINEAKSSIMPKAALVTEEPDLEQLFADAFDEVSSQVGDHKFRTDYGFQSEWEDEEEQDDNLDEENLKIEATKVLFDSISDYPGNEENIERFCLPLFAAADSDYAVDHVMSSFKKRPSMTQIYCAYLARFLDSSVQNLMLSTLQDKSLFDWQRMWLLAGLTQNKKGDDAVVKAALDLLKSTDCHDALRAVAAIYVGRYGDHARRTALRSLYSSASNYVQAAIFYSSQKWPSAERATAKASWSGHGVLHDLLTPVASSGAGKRKGS
ncbi:RNA-directed DNA polymerase [Methyloceanibacter sp.]|uniref:RNA-directed DNA polymerase n=1 Tax=Methyloceanibacter sp. TaxID=1965321 RepID=UPI003D6CD1E8